jgi:hypothetical protein
MSRVFKMTVSGGSDAYSGLSLPVGGGSYSLPEGSLAMREIATTLLVALLMGASSAPAQLTAVRFGRVVDGKGGVHSPTSERSSTAYVG